MTEYDGAFVTAYEKEAKENGRVHVFVCEVDGQTKYVIPVYGAGLWGAIWGYVSLNEDKNTVYGTYFSHASENSGIWVLKSLLNIFRVNSRTNTFWMEKTLA